MYILISVSFYYLIPIFSNNGIHRKPWDQNFVTAKTIGNPANSSLVQDLMKSLKHRFGAEGGTRTHSMAMSVVHMEKIATHIARICPGESPSIPCCTLGDKELRLHCLEYMAFATTSWTLWLRYLFNFNWTMYVTNPATRNDEGVKLQVKHLTFGLETKDHLRMPYWTVSLVDRKG